MKTLPLIFAVLLMSKAQASNLILARGQNARLPVGPTEKIHITNRDVVKVKDLGSHLSITGAKIGYSSVIIRSKIFKIIVAPIEVANSYQRFHKILHNFKGLSLEATPSAASIRGELLRFSDWAELGEHAQKENLVYKFEAQLDDDLQKEARSYIRNLLAKSELPPVRIVFDGGARVLLPKEFEGRRPQYRSLLAPLGISIEKDHSTVALAPMVEVEILVAEVRRSYLRSFGVSWPEEYRAALNPGTGGLSQSSLEFALQAMEAKGGGRILASPKLLCRSGKEAEFLAGGELPFAIRHKLKNEIMWKKHGVILKVKPLADLSGRMSIDIETEVSVINPRDRIEDLPSFRTNRIKSHFDLEGTRTIALSGLLKNIEAEGRRGLPLLSDIPILGSLFSSKDYLEEKTELVFFVTPRLVPYDTPSVQRTIPQWEANE